MQKWNKKGLESCDNIIANCEEGIVQLECAISNSHMDKSMRESFKKEAINLRIRVRLMEERKKLYLEEC